MENKTVIENPQVGDEMPTVTESVVETTQEASQVQPPLPQEPQMPGGVPNQPANQFQPTPKKKNSLGIILGIVAVILVVSSVGGYFGYKAIMTGVASYDCATFQEQIDKFSAGGSKEEKQAADMMKKMDLVCVSADEKNYNIEAHYKITLHSDTGVIDRGDKIEPAMKATISRDNVEADFSEFFLEYGSKHMTVE